MKRSKPVTIAMICGAAPPVQCGVGDYAACLSRALAVHGTSVTLVTSRFGMRTETERGLIGVQWTDPINDWTLREFKALSSTICTINPDVLHLQFPAKCYNGILGAYICVWFRLRFRRPVIVTLHEHISPVAPVWLAMVQTASAVISVRPNFRDGYRRLLSLTAATKPFYFIPNASSLPFAQCSISDVLDIRRRLGVPPGKNLVAYFGLIYPRRGVEQLFEIVDPAIDHLVIIGGMADFAPDYVGGILELVRSSKWRDAVTVTGFLPDTEAAGILAAADAVVLPFAGSGGGIWNTSIHGARLQGTVVITTSQEGQGFVASQNTYWAKPFDIEGMRAALRTYIGRRHPNSADDVPRWDQIAGLHQAVYLRYASAIPASF